MEKQKQELNQLHSTLADRDKEVMIQLYTDTSAINGCQVKRLTEAVDTTKQKLDECKEVLKTNENGMSDYSHVLV